jgi:tetratricopeptide (TPR) repeat protein
MRITKTTWPAWVGFAGLLALEWGVWGVAQDQQAPVPPPQESTQQAPAKRILTDEDRADIFMARKSYADAVDYYYRGLRQTNFTNATLWNKLGIAYQSLQSYKKSRKAYKRAIHLRRDFPEPWNNIGTTFYMQRKYKKSVKYYEQAIKLKPDTASFHLNLGASYFGMKHYEQCVVQTRMALSLDPNILTERSSVGTIMETRYAGPRFYYYMAKVFASLGRPEEAVRYLRRAMEDGFKDRKMLDADPDFQKISKTPAYVELLKNPPVPIKD